MNGYLRKSLEDGVCIVQAPSFLVLPVQQSGAFLKEGKVSLVV